MSTSKKIDKEFCITDSSVNCYKYRCMTEGLQIDEILKNPIGYFQHGTEEFPRESGVLVRWEDFRKDGDKVFAKPIINLSHPRAERTILEIESGFLNAASVGKIVVLEASDDKKYMIPGQEKATVLKWYPREISLVDIPGNYNALSNLYDSNLNVLNLSDLTKSNIEYIEKEKILKVLNIAIADDNKILSIISNLVSESRKVRELEKELSTLKDGVQYKNRTWDDLYKSDEIETVRQKFPDLYEKLKNKKFPNLKS